jgi:hypothetical protein
MRDLVILFVQVIGSVAKTLSLGKSLGSHRKSKALWAGSGVVWPGNLEDSTFQSHLGPGKELPQR